MLIVCTHVGTFGESWALIDTVRVAGRSAEQSSYFSTRNAESAGLMEIRSAILTRPPDSTSHHAASVLSRPSDSDRPDPNTIVGQSLSPLLIGKGLYAESASFDELRPSNRPAPTGQSSFLGTPMARTLKKKSLVKERCAASRLTEGGPLQPKCRCDREIDHWC